MSTCVCERENISLYYIDRYYLEMRPNNSIFMDIQREVWSICTYVCTHIHIHTYKSLYEDVFIVVCNIRNIMRKMRVSKFLLDHDILLALQKRTLSKRKKV